MSIIKEKRSTPGMGVTMATDGSQIFLRWDLKFPPYVDAKVVKRPEDILFYWDHIREFCKWVEYKRCFVLTFSKQNLQRIHAQFGQIQCTHGYHHIQELKAGNESFAKMVERAKKIIEMPFDQLPKYDYKAPPLAEYQHRANIYLCNVYAAPIFADCGCLSGYTNIGVRFVPKGIDANQSDEYPFFQIKLSALFEVYCAIKSFVDMFVISYDENTDSFVENIITNVLNSGIKEVFKLSLSTGESICLTEDHEVQTQRGMIQLKDLDKNNDRVIVCDNGDSMPRKISYICSDGYMETYDISCRDPYRNFVANGIVVHNCGKTWMVLNSTERQIKLGTLERGKTLVAVKLPTIETGWLDDCRKFTDLKIQNLWFPSSKKKDDKFMEALHSGADLFVLNHDTARIYQQELVEYGFDKVVIDESTILKGFHSEHPNAKGGQFGKAILDIARRAKYRVILSGTPAPNSPEDLWGQFKFLDPNGYSLFERSFYDYRNEFMDVVDIRPQNKRFREVEGGQKIFVPLGPKDPKKYKPKKDTPQRIYDFLGRYAFRVRLRDVIKDFPEKTVVQRMIHMSPELRAHYDKMEDELQVIINDERIVASIKLTQMQKLRQLTGGFIIDHKEEVHPVEENNKLEELDSILDDEISHDDKVVIYAQYRHEIEAIEKRYKKYGIVSVYGGNTTKQNLDNIRKFKEDPKIRLIVLHPKSAAHGITFTCAHYMIFYSYDHSAEDAYQCKSRIERAGQKHNMIIFYLSCYKTVDEDTYKAVLLKIHNQSYLIDGTAPTEEDQESINKLLLNQFKERRKNAVDRPA